MYCKEDGRSQGEKMPKRQLLEDMKQVLIYCSMLFTIKQPTIMRNIATFSCIEHRFLPLACQLCCFGNWFRCLSQVPIFTE